MEIVWWHSGLNCDRAQGSCVPQSHPTAQNLHPVVKKRETPEAAARLGVFLLDTGYTRGGFCTLTGKRQKKRGFGEFLMGFAFSAVQRCQQQPCSAWLGYIHGSSQRNQQGLEDKATTAPGTVPVDVQQGSVELRARPCCPPQIWIPGGKGDVEAGPSWREM